MKHAAQPDRTRGKDILYLFVEAMKTGPKTVPELYRVVRQHGEFLKPEGVSSTLSRHKDLFQCASGAWHLRQDHVS